MSADNYLILCVLFAAATAGMVGFAVGVFWERHRTEANERAFLKLSASLST